MAVKRVTDGVTTTTGQRPSSSGDLASMLGNAGLLSGGRDPLKTATALLGALAAKGFGALGTNVEASLKVALSAFQRSQGLPVTGKLDAATVRALGAAGMLPGQGVHAFSDGFERQPAKSTTNSNATPAQTSTTVRDVTDKLSAFFRAAFGGVFGGAGGAQKDASSSVDAKAQKPGDAFSSEHDASSPRPGATPDGRVVVDDRAGGRALGEKERGFARGSIDSDGRQVASSSDGQQNSGALDGDNVRTRRRGEGEALDDDAQPDDAGDDANGDDETASADGHTSSGDDQRDDAQKSANLDDKDAPPGFTRVPSLTRQVLTSFNAIVRDPDEENRAATYSLDVTYLRPGVYGAGQAAPPLLHLVVEHAAMADPVWDRALSRVTGLLHDAGARTVDIPERADLLAAIRRARYRSTP